MLTWEVETKTNGRAETILVSSIFEVHVNFQNTKEKKIIEGRDQTQETNLQKISIVDDLNVRRKMLPTPACNPKLKQSRKPLSCTLKWANSKHSLQLP